MKINFNTVDTSTAFNSSIQINFIHKMILWCAFNAFKETRATVIVLFNYLLLITFLLK